MRSTKASPICWTGHKKMEELLDDPLAESLYGLFLKAKDSPRHIAIKPEKLINEAYYISYLICQDSESCCSIDKYAQEIESDMGWGYAVELVMSMVYVILKSKKICSKRIDNHILLIENRYMGCCYWELCKPLLESRKPAKNKNLYMHKDLSSLLKNNKELAKMLGGNPVFIINNVEQLNAILGDHAEIEK